MNNFDRHVKLIIPYQTNDFGIWVFDDPITDLKIEPFVGMTNTIIDHLICKYQIKDASDGFKLYFSDRSFLGWQVKLYYVKTENGWNHYKYIHKEKEFIGPLCPMFYRYFENPPRTIYVKVANLKTGE